MDNEKLSIYEILGVLHNEEWQYPGCYDVFRIHDGVREYREHGGIWLQCNNEKELLEIIKRPQYIIHLPIWTETDEKDAASILRVCGNFNWATRRKDKSLIVYLEEPYWNGHYFCGNSKFVSINNTDLLPSLKVNTKANLSEIVEFTM